jgi:hypothetical protein
MRNDASPTDVAAQRSGDRHGCKIVGVPVAFAFDQDRLCTADETIEPSAPPLCGSIPKSCSAGFYRFALDLRHARGRRRRPR